MLRRVLPGGDVRLETVKGGRQAMATRSTVAPAGRPVKSLRHGESVAVWSGLAQDGTRGRRLLPRNGRGPPVAKPTPRMLYRKVSPFPPRMLLRVVAVAAGAGSVLAACSSSSGSGGGAPDGGGVVCEPPTCALGVDAGPLPEAGEDAEAIVGCGALGACGSDAGPPPEAGEDAEAIVGCGALGACGSDAGPPPEAGEDAEASAGCDAGCFPGFHGGDQ